ncbi:MAG: hypothetical protein J1E62_03295 [Lachnospiraceae bacterium]|nr:hypothetical protein [Lachnospiraceae bacterium]
MRQMDGKKCIAMTGISGMLIAGLIAGNLEYATHTYRYDKIAQAGEIKQVTEEATDFRAASKKGKVAVTKEETVYATLDAGGAVTDVIVSDWLKNSAQAEGVQDATSLEDIVNTKGDEKFERDNEKITWETNGQDIYYQGKTASELPIGMEITYSLDGKEVKPEDILGKSGKLEMHIRYSNYSKQTIRVNGKREKIYTPFLMATGMILPVDKFNNISIDHGKVLSEGDNTIVVAYGMPGLSESLAIDETDFDDVDIDTDEIKDKMSDSVTITADVVDFSMGATYTVAAADIFQDLSVNDIGNIDELEEKIDDVEDASVQLVDGSGDLESGLKTLKDNFSTYADGIDTANKGAKKLKKGAKSLKSGTDKYTKGTDKLLKGVGTYVDGSGTLAKGIKSYTSGAKTISDGLNELNNATKDFPTKYKQFGDGVKTFVDSVVQLLSEENMKQLQAGTTSLKEGIESADKGVKQLQAGVSEMNSQIKTFKETSESAELAQCQGALEQLKDEYVEKAKNASTSEERAKYTALASALGGASAYIDGGKQAATALDAATNGKADGALDGNGQGDLALGLKQLQAATDVKSKDTNLYIGASALEESVTSIAGYAKQLRESSPDLLNGEKTVRSGIGDVSTNVKKLADGGKTLSGNNKALNDGAQSVIDNSSAIKKNSKKITSSSKTLRKGASDMAKGTKTLFAGTGKLAKATNALTKGIRKLYDGSGDLHDGIIKFKKQAVDKLTSAANDVSDEVGGLTDRLHGIRNASKEYRSFSGIPDDMEGSVKFVLSTKEVKEEE